MKKSNKKNRKKNKGFTLIEAVISIALFGMISIFMSNFVITIGKYTLDNDRRNDISADVDAMSTAVKNELRNAESISIPSGNCIRFTKRASEYNIKLNNGQLSLSSGNCTTGSNIRNFNNIQVSKVVRLLPTVTTYGTGSKTTLLNVSIVACDPYGTSDNDPGKIFSCDESLNPYIVSFALAIDKLKI